MAWNPFAGLFGKKEAPVAPAARQTLDEFRFAALMEPRPVENPPGTVRFACNLFAEAAKKEPGKNVFISPASISFALAMAYNGADGETRDEMAKALEFQGLSLEDVNAGGKILKTLLERNEKKVELAIANSLWSKTGTSFKDEFLKIAGKYYAAAVRELDFSKPEAAAEINAWVAEKTRGKITQIVGRDMGDVLLLLINALYFKGDWAEGFEFEASRTVSRPFHLINGATRDVPLMSHSSEYAYVESPSVQVACIPYGERNVSMIVALPREHVNFMEFCCSLNAGQWEAWIGAMKGRPGNLTLPKFKLEYETELSDVLKPLGMVRAFDKNFAQFPAMCSKPLFISKVKHKTFVDVNETGTEAAAVTAVEMVLCAGIPEEPPPPFEMIVDRPFLCAIRDERTGTLLFMGAIVEPKESLRN